MPCNPYGSSGPQWRSTMERDETDTEIGKELTESECYAFKIGFNAAVVTTLADSLSDDDGMRMDTLIEAVAAEFAAQFVEDEDCTSIDDFLSAIMERVLENLGEPGSSLAVTGFDLTMEFASRRRGCDGCRGGCSCEHDGDRIDLGVRAPTYEREEGLQASSGLGSDGPGHEHQAQDLH